MNAACLLLGAVRTIPIVFLAMSVFVLLILIVIITVLARPNKSGVALGLTLLGMLTSLFCFAFVGYFVLVPRRAMVEFRSAGTAPAFRPTAPAVPKERSFDVHATEDNAVSSSVDVDVVDLSSASRSWDPWDAVVEDTLRANVYSSIAGAERALARECLSELGPHLAETPETVSVTVDPVASSKWPTLGSTLNRVIQESLPLATVQTKGRDSDTPDVANAVVLAIDLPEFQITTTNVPAFSQSTGLVKLHGTYIDHTFEGTKRFAEKPWVSRFEEFVSNHPQRTLLRANCRSFATYETAAYNDAIDVAVQSLFPRAFALLAAQPDGRARAVASENSIRQQLRAAIERNELVADRFSQQLDGSSGTVWRATLLVDYRPEQLTQLVNQGLVVSQFEQRGRIVTGTAVALMFGLVVALYLVVNELTKGYFVWNLRAAAMLALLSIVVAVCWWIR